MKIFKISVFLFALCLSTKAATLPDIYQKVDRSNATASSLMKFDSQLRAINAVPGTDYGLANNWLASGPTNSTLPGIGMAYSLVATNGITVGNGSTAGFEAWFDGGSHWFSISPQTMTTSANIIPDTAPATGFWFGTLGSVTNETLTHIGSSGSGNVARVTSPTFVTPTLGAAIATSINGNSIPSASDTVVLLAASQTLTGKTYDAAATGNTLKFKNYLIFSTPHFGDGVGSIQQTNDNTLPTFGHYKFSGSAATNANYVVYIVSVPTDIDTSVDLRARLKVRLSATETSASTFNIGVQDVADSASGSFAGVTSAATWVQVPISADASGAANKLETSAYVTLTGWRSALTADHAMFIVVNRDGAGDSANTGISDAELKIEYGVTQ